MLVDHFQDQLPAIGAVEDILPVAVNPFALFVHHLVVFQQVLADVEVLLFHLLLRPFNPPRDHAAFNGLAFLHPQPGEDVLDPLAGEDPHQVVFQREVEAAAAGVALPSATAAELQVDAAGFVPLGADDVQSAHAGHHASFGLHLLALLDLADQRVPFVLGHFQSRGILFLQPRPGHGLGVAAENDVGAAAGHVRGNRHRAQPARLGHDLGLALMVLGVQDLVRDAAFFQQAGDQLAPLDRHRAHQHRTPAALNLLDLALGDGLAVLAPFRLELDGVVGFVDDAAEILFVFLVDQHVPLVHPLDFIGDGDILLAFGAVDHVGVVDPPQRHVGGDRDHVELVDLPELGGLRHGRARHAANLVIELEKVLQRDRGQGLVLLLDAHAFLGLDCLVQAVAPVASRHQAARELVDDHHLLAVDHVVHVALVEVVGLQGVIDQVRPFHVPGRVKTLHARQLLRRPHAFVGQMRGVLFLVDLEVRVLLQLPRQAVGLGVARDVVVGGAGDDQRRAGFVDENVVHLVDDGKVQRALRLLVVFRIAVVALGRRAHVVAQIVEAELVVRAVGDVALIGFLAIGRAHVALDRPHAQPQRHVNRAHPFHVAAPGSRSP